MKNMLICYKKVKIIYSTFVPVLSIPQPKEKFTLPFCLFDDQGNFVMVCSFKTQTSQTGFVISSLISSGLKRLC